MGNSEKKPMYALSRLREAYLLWHKMAEHYEDPEEFRIYLNATIQALRNVTFILQKQKSEINNFDDWYKKWQDALKTDPIMTWCVMARNKIVKEGDLKTYSLARASYVASYNEPPKIDYRVDPFVPTNEIALKIANTNLPTELREKGYLRVERRWIAEGLKDYELLESLSYAFANLAQLVMDVENQHGPSFSFKNESGEKYIDQGMTILGIDYDLLPPCMASFADYRTIWVKLSTMETFFYITKVDKFMPTQKEKIIERYGKVDIPPERLEGKSGITKIALQHLEQAKRMLHVDGYLIPVVFTMDERNHFYITPLELPSHEDKYAVWLKIAEIADKRHIKAVIAIAEGWMSPFDSKFPDRRAEDSPERTEVIQVSVASKEGEEFTINVPFYRKDNTIEYGDNLPVEKIAANYLAPIKRVWNKQDSEEEKPKNRYYLEYHEPSPKQPCLCGSGKKFKKCCGIMYKTDERNGARESYNEGNYKEALRKCRLDITWYILCYKAHTVPFLESKTKKAYELLKVDIYAMSSLLDLLLKCYDKTGKLKDFPYVLESLENTISDERWFNRISYYRAFWSYIYSGERKKAFHELNKIKDIHSVLDQDILTMYIDVAQEELPFLKKITLIDQILSTNPEPGVALKYMTLKGIDYFLNAEKETGIELIEVGINNFRETNKEIKLGHDNFQLAQSLEMLGELKGDDNLLKEAQMRYKKELESNSYNSSGVAMLLKHLGNAFYAEGNYPESAKYYENSLKENANEETTLFYVKTLIKLGNTDKAAELLEINSDVFMKFAQFDFSCAWALLAVDTKKRQHIDKAIKLLEGLKPKMPYFAEMRDDFLLKLKNIEQLISIPKC